LKISFYFASARHAERLHAVGTWGNNAVAPTAKFKENAATVACKAIGKRLAQPALHGDRAGNVSAGDQPVQ
jgi:hypothetical protein